MCGGYDLVGRHFLIRKFQAIRLLCAFVVETGLYIDGDGEILFVL